MRAKTTGITEVAPPAEGKSRCQQSGGDLVPVQH